MKKINLDTEIKIINTPYDNERNKIEIRGIVKKMGLFPWIKFQMENNPDNKYRYFELDNEEYFLINEYYYPSTLKDIPQDIKEQMEKDIEIFKGMLRKFEILQENFLKITKKYDKPIKIEIPVYNENRIVEFSLKLNYFIKFYGHGNGYEIYLKVFENEKEPIKQKLIKFLEKEYEYSSEEDMLLIRSGFEYSSNKIEKQIEKEISKCNILIFDYLKEVFKK